MIEALIGLLIAAVVPEYSYASEPREVLIEVRSEKTVEEKIRETFHEQPDLMVKVAQCESGMQNIPGRLSDDGGIFQINVVHEKELKKQGLDRFNIDDNIKFARQLYDQSGLQPWKYSKHCWSK